MNKTKLFIPLLLLILFSCSPDPLKVDVSAVKIEKPVVMRLEDDLFGLNESNFAENSRLIREKYGIVYEHYLINPLRVRGTGDSLYKTAVLNFINDHDVHATYEIVRRIYTPQVLDNITNELELCFKRFRFHFPERKLPEKFITSITGWNYAFAYMDNCFLLGLDMYLGDTATVYQMLRYPKYQTRKMNPDHILPDMMRGWLLTEFDKEKPENTLLNHTIFYGKLFYGVKALLPDTPDSLIIGYTGKQMDLCNKYEKQYWSYFAEKGRLYESNLQTIRELTSEGPFTGAISKECPPRIAMWIGWQIVRSYMKNNKDVSLKALMTEKDAQKILTKSKYRP